MSKRRKYRFHDLAVNGSYTYEADAPEWAVRDARRIRKSAQTYGELHGRRYSVRVEHASIIVRRVA